MVIIEDLVGKYLKEKLNNNWMANQINKSKLPYIVEEAVFNSFLLASIYKYIEEQKIYLGFAVSEAQIERYNSKGYADIIFYDQEDMYYFELKGSCYGSSSAKQDVRNAIKGLDYAKLQVEGINYNKNEEWYKIKPHNRYGGCLSMIQSTVNNGKSNFFGIEKELNNSNVTIFHKEKFEYSQYPIITDKDKIYENDGYFIIGYLCEVMD